MRRMIFMLLALAAFAGSATLVYAGSDLNLPYRTERMWKMTHDVSKMLGVPVTDRDGKIIAKVKDFVLDEQGRIAFAILGHSGDKGAEKLVAVPYAVLFYNDADKEFISNITEEQLAGAPVIKDTADLAGHAYAGKVDRYFGVRPSWGEEESSAAAAD